MILVFSQEHHPGESNNYNNVIIHETLRVAVCDALERNQCPDQLLLVWGVLLCGAKECLKGDHGLCCWYSGQHSYRVVPCIWGSKVVLFRSSDLQGSQYQSVVGQILNKVAMCQVKIICYLSGQMATKCPVNLEALLRGALGLSFPESCNIHEQKLLLGMCRPGNI